MKFEYQYPYSKTALGCAAHGGHGREEWGRRFSFFERFAVLDGQGTAKDAKIWMANTKILI